MKDAKGHGSEKRGGGMPIPGHDYHTKSDAALRFIAKDAGEAEKNVRSFDSQAASKYSDQIANAASVLGYRARGGTDFSDRSAAADLARGNPKADTAPVHPAMLNAWGQTAATAKAVRKQLRMDRINRRGRSYP